ncbi:unnamed protein product [Urochloa humidicola]
MGRPWCKVTAAAYGRASAVLGPRRCAASVPAEPRSGSIASGRRNLAWLLIVPFLEAEVAAKKAELERCRETANQLGRECAALRRARVSHCIPGFLVWGSIYGCCLRG